MENVNNRNIKLVKALELISDYELMKPIDEIDGDLIDATVDWSLRLQNKDITLSTEEIEKMVSMIPFEDDTEELKTNGEVLESRKVLKKNKVLFIAAVITILVTLLTIISVAFEWNIFEELKNRFGTVADTPVNEEIVVDGVTVVRNDEYRKYSTIEEALKSENIDVLYPSYLPEGLALRKISFYNEFEKERIMFLFEDNTISAEICFNKKVDFELMNSSTKVEKINAIQCYFCIKKDIGWVQVYFENDGNLYGFSGYNEQKLVEIIENLKELE